MFSTEIGHIITGLVKDSNGEITAYQIDNNEIIMKEEAVMLAKQGAIKGVNTEVSKLKEEFLKSIPDGNKYNNLEDLPVINEDQLS